MSLRDRRRKERKASYRPLVITARLRCGIVSDGLLPIDAILYYAQHRQANPGGRIMTTSRASAQVWGEGVLPLVLPIQRLNGGRPEWYYAASCARWSEPAAEGLDYWTKRVDVAQAHFVETTARVPISGGRYRAYRMPTPYRHALGVSWCVVGEPEQIRGLLHLVTHLGKKTEMGWGCVMEWSVEPASEDWSVRATDGSLTRPVPVDAGGILYGYRPPYWHPRNQTMCEMPSYAVAA